MEELAFRNFLFSTKKHSFLFFILARCNDNNSEKNMKKITCPNGLFVGGSTIIVFFDFLQTVSWKVQSVPRIQAASLSSVQRHGL